MSIRVPMNPLRWDLFIQGIIEWGLYRGMKQILAQQFGFVEFTGADNQAFRQLLESRAEDRLTLTVEQNLFNYYLGSIEMLIGSQEYCEFDQLDVFIDASFSECIVELNFLRGFASRDARVGSFRGPYVDTRLPERREILIRELTSDAKAFCISTLSSWLSVGDVPAALPFLYRETTLHGMQDTVRRLCGLLDAASGAVSLSASDWWRVLTYTELTSNSEIFGNALAVRNIARPNEDEIFQGMFLGKLLLGVVE